VESVWTVYGKRADFNKIGKKYNIDPVVARVMRNRDIVGDDSIREYLYGTLDDTYNPETMADMDKGCAIMAEAIKNGEKICIVSDYDVDGVMSNYVLWDGLTRLGGRVTYRIPDRIKDGYGINEAIIREAYEENTGTIITCDNGISAGLAINLAKELGMKVIVTDHHVVPYTIDENGQKLYKLPPADAVIDIMRQDCPYPGKNICGTTVAYKFIRELYKHMEMPWDDPFRYIEMIAIATVCDVMELKGENRIYVKEGLKLLEDTDNTGLQALLEVCGLKNKKLSAFHLGFVIGPCINAAGRLESAKQGLELLMSKNKSEALDLAVRLRELNIHRKDMTEEGVNQAIEMVKNNYMEDKVLVVYMPDLHESIAGIVAGRLREHFYKPVFVITDSNDGGLKGSGRSIEGYHMADSLNQIKDILIKYGGHELAAGFSLLPENLENFRKRLNDNQKLTSRELTPTVRLDAAMPVSYITLKLVEQLQLLEPFGKGNEKPMFGQSNLGIKSVSFMGKENQYVKIYFQNEEGYVIEGVDFNGKSFIECIKMWFGDEECDKILKGVPNKVKLDVAYYPLINQYGGKKTIQIQPYMYQRT